MKKLLSLSLVLFLLSNCSTTVNNKATHESRENKMADNKTMVIEKETTASEDKTEFEQYLVNKLNEAKQPISHKDWMSFFIFTKDSDQFESPTINMLTVKDLSISFMKPIAYEKFAESFNQKTLEDWFYPNHYGDLNYLINQSFYIPIFYTNFHENYAIAYISAIVNDNGVYPNIKLFVYDKQGIQIRQDSIPEIYLFRQCAFEGSSSLKTCDISKNKLLQTEIERGCGDEENYELPYEKRTEKIYFIHKNSLTLTKDELIYRANASKLIVHYL